ncbi:UDP-N-acetylmuramoyl-tripeptide--D-alanyl-D-alanine ligase [Nocardioides sp. HDW12B]|uniref:UDP-N-acetylmuramoyl-tripeptide--D-alanyl-D- alanine ligase n=1 Tax=Nocardioides sp. HDW12B TaxID=2714939 RepID=UPI00140DAFDA|nr:Mur ligase family protein [Nocardioides sp. HDW12B]QIK66895.1 UDP-N-acetylmuramoyl-tripeptide--D-alanyl-D-alanine ligase [Nocardioides sp. HDW12B]
MIALTLPEIAAVVGGEVVDDPDGVVVRGAASVDSREIEPDGLFAAFVGERSDGHDFAGAAVAAGAAAVLGSRATGHPTVLVEDPQAALGALAHHVLGRLPDVTVLAVTGSQGKTSTKDLLAGVLAAHAETVATRGSFNNELGLPLTVLRAGTGTRFLLLEMGARGIGHLRELCAIARPDVSLVLNVGKAHLGEFGTQDDIATAKGELVEALTPDGVAVLNADDPRVAAMAARTAGRVVTFGTLGSTLPTDEVPTDVVAAAFARDAPTVGYADVRLDAEGRPTFALVVEWRRVPVTLQLVGAHHVPNAAAAVAAAAAVGIGLEEAAASLAGVSTVSRWRMEVARRADGVVVVNDAYNANPDSMRAALEALVSIGAGGSARRRVAVLGEMKELGASADAEHAEVGRLARSLGVDVLLAVGEAARPALTGFDATHGDDGEDGMAGQSDQVRAVAAADNEAAVRWLGEHLRADDVVLVKASRGARLDEVAAALLADDRGVGA